MTRINISVPEDLREDMRKYPEINWSKVCQRAIARAILEEEARRAEIICMAMLED
jgi:post-segregation antitoxin (ccd killing protein)